jgi:hypothetical protein
MAQRKALALTDIVCVSAHQMASRVGEELAILDLEQSVYYGLDPVGARIWELLQTPTALSSVVDVVVAEFDVDYGTARADLLALVGELLDKQLVNLRGSHAP